MLKIPQSEILTVDEVTDKVRVTLCSVPELQNLSVRGELQGFKRHTSGHVYFTLIGKNSRVSCILWRSQAASILSWPKDGDEVLVRGKLDVYGAYGSYQLYAATLLPLGAGAKARAKALLQQKLEAEGVFDVRSKRPFPRYPDKVAVITSPTSAALQDVLRISSQRWPLAELVVIPSLMQGVSAAAEITAAFAKAAKIPELSAVMFVRGGGSRDDLDVFDVEEVVRAVRACPVPVVTGLGHQIDSTLCDLAADAEAPTPSGAAEFLFPDKNEISALLEGVKETFSGAVYHRLDRAENFLGGAAERFTFSLLKGWCVPLKDTLEAQYRLLSESMRHKLVFAENSLVRLAARLNDASPLSILAKGYTVCLDGDGRMIQSVDGVTAGDKINVHFKDGSAKAIICETEKKVS